jgi:hypothetical protein
MNHVTDDRRIDTPCIKREIGLDGVGLRLQCVVLQMSKQPLLGIGE